MLEYYFDTETTGINPNDCKIITIQYQPLDRYSWEPTGELQILKEWESSEKAIIEQIYPLTHSANLFAFIPIGNNLMFDFHFLETRSKKYGLNGYDLYYCRERPFLDLKNNLVVINDGTFRGYSRILDNGSLDDVDVPELYKEEKYQEILDYIKTERDFFLAALCVLKGRCPNCKKVLRDSPM